VSGSYCQRVAEVREEQGNVTKKTLSKEERRVKIENDYRQLSGRVIADRVHTNGSEEG